MILRVTIALTAFVCVTPSRPSPVTLRILRKDVKDTYRSGFHRDSVLLRVVTPDVADYV